MKSYCSIELENNKILYYQCDTGSLFVGTEGTEALLPSIDSLGDPIKKIEREVKEHNSIRLNFMASRTCNMGCKYCFAGEGEYEDNPNKPKIMKRNVYQRTFDWVMNVKNKDIDYISFFGGEPLIDFKEFKEAIHQLKIKCEEEQRSFPKIALSTNGVLFNDEILEFFKQYKVKVGLSADGPSYVNDYGRIPKNGVTLSKSSFRFVYDMAEQLHENNLLYAIQFTINGEHIKQYKPGIVKQWIYDMGNLAKAEMVYIPVSTNHKDLKILDIETLKEIAREIVDFYIDELMKQGTQYTSSLITSPLLGIIYKKYFQSCGGGDGFYLIDTDGEIYPCHIFCNDSSYKMGNIYDANDFDESIEKRFLENNRSFNKDCQKCCARNVCKVWCNGMQYMYSGKEDEVLPERCEFQRAIVEQGLRRIMSMKITDEQLFKQVIERMIMQNKKYYQEKNS